MAEEQVELSDDEVFELLRKYHSSSTVQKLNEYYNELSFLDILRVDRKENYHSNFLKWIFADQELCEISIKSLLLLLLKRDGQYKDKKTRFTDKVRKRLLTTSFFIEHVEAKLEDSAVTKEKKGRSDILITIKYRNSEKPLYVIVENKVNSKEHTGQTKRYYEYYTEKYNAENCIFVFLTQRPSKDLLEPECECKSFIQINYQDILDEILSPLLNEESIQPRKHFIIKEYIKALSINYSQQNNIMAMNDELRKLLVDFWTNNEQLITLSLSALKDDDTLDYDTTSVSTAIEKLGKAKDKTHYKFNGNTYPGKGALVEAILEYCIKEERLDTNTINKKWNDFLVHVKSFDKTQDWTFKNHKIDIEKNIEIESKKLLKQNVVIVCDDENEKEKINNFDHNFKQTTIKGITYWYYTQWGWKNIDLIIGFYRDKIKKGKDPDIELIFT
ncbi:MAG: PD-(D/E)XK nuclease family protein [Bacteroidales bacterium]|nr:PD-(D/E)XK nuclease family protein [Bacteroidales bacterium]